MRQNQDVRDAAKAAGVKMWEIAERLGISEFTLSRTMRHKLSPCYHDCVMQIIDQLVRAKDMDCASKEGGDSFVGYHT